MVTLPFTQYSPSPPWARKMRHTNGAVCNIEAPITCVCVFSFVFLFVIAFEIVFVFCVLSMLRNLSGECCGSCTFSHLAKAARSKKGKGGDT